MVEEVSWGGGGGDGAAALGAAGAGQQQVGVGGAVEVRRRRSGSRGRGVSRCGSRSSGGGARQVLGVVIGGEAAVHQQGKFRDGRLDSETSLLSGEMRTR